MDISSTGTTPLHRHCIEDTTKAYANHVTSSREYAASNLKAAFWEGVLVIAPRATTETSFSWF